MRYFLDCGQIVKSPEALKLPELDPLKAPQLYEAQERDKTDRPVGLAPQAVRDAILPDDHEEKKAQGLRRIKRDSLLAESDWTQMPDALKGKKAIKDKWASYRQQLRDLDMASDEWPTSPEKKQ